MDFEKEFNRFGTLNFDKIVLINNYIFFYTNDLVIHSEKVHFILYGN